MTKSPATTKKSKKDKAEKKPEPFKHTVHLISPHREEVPFELKGREAFSYGCSIAKKHLGI